jgi:hypothetical protein
MLAVDD